MSYPIVIGLGIPVAALVIYSVQKCMKKNTAPSSVKQVVERTLASSAQENIPHINRQSKSYKLTKDFMYFQNSKLPELFKIAQIKEWINEYSLFKLQQSDHYLDHSKGGNGIDRIEIDCPGLLARLTNVVSFGCFPNFSPFIYIKYNLNGRKVMAIIDDSTTGFNVDCDFEDRFLHNAPFSMYNPDCFKNIQNLLMNGNVIDGFLTLPGNKLASNP